jgi:hypothetical protein
VPPWLRSGCKLRTSKPMTLTVTPLNDSVKNPCTRCEHYLKSPRSSGCSSSGLDLVEVLARCRTFESRDLPGGGRDIPSALRLCRPDGSPQLINFYVPGAPHDVWQRNLRRRSVRDDDRHSLHDRHRIYATQSDGTGLICYSAGDIAVAKLSST